MTCSQVAIINRGQLVATDTLDNLMGELTSDIIYDIEVGGERDDLETAVRSSLGNLQNIRSIEPLSDEHLTENRYRFRVKAEPSHEPGSDIAAAVLANQLQLFEMRRTRASLEEIFLQLTMQERTETMPALETHSSEEIEDSDFSEDVIPGIESLEKDTDPDFSETIVPDEVSDDSNSEP